MAPASLQRKRQDKFLRAVLAGATFEKKGLYEEPLHVPPIRTRPGWVNAWFITVPQYRLSGQFGYTNGPHKFRYLAVDQAMKLMELE